MLPAFNCTRVTPTPAEYRECRSENKRARAQKDTRTQKGRQTDTPAVPNAQRTIDVPKTLYAHWYMCIPKSNACVRTSQRHNYQNDTNYVTKLQPWMHCCN